MAVRDLYGFMSYDIEAARTMTEQALGLKLVPHDSLYLGGYHYEYQDSDGEYILVRENLDLIDQEPAELAFPEVRILLYIDGSPRAKELEQLLLTKIADIRLLRRQELPE
jgi:hypothetical protein